MTQRLTLFAMLCAVALAAADHSAQAQLPTVSLSLNLRYHDPADPTEGGRWFLVAKTSAAAGNLGLAGLDVYLANIDPTGIVFGNGGVFGFSYPAVSAADIGADNSGPLTGLVDGFAHIAYAQDNSPEAATPLRLSVGQGLTAGNVQLDPLRGTNGFGQTVNTTWNNAALIASGTFPGGGDATNQLGRPTFATPASAAPIASVLTSATLGSPLAPASLSRVVRGDSLVELGLSAPGDAGFPRGDRNRDFEIDGDDLTGLLLWFGASGRSWDEGDVTDGLPGHIEGRVDGDDLNQVLLGFNTGYKGPTGTAPLPGTAVPEPAASLIAVLLTAGAVTAFRRRVSCAAGGPQ